MGLFDFAKKKEFAEIECLTEEVEQLNSTIANKDKVIANLQETIETQAETIKTHKETIAEINAKLLEEKNSTLQQKYNESYKIYKKLKKDVAILSGSLEAMEYGIYTPVFDFDDSEVYKNNMLQAGKDASEMIKDGLAVKGGEYKFRKRMTKVILLGFNGICDNCISSVKWNNVFQMQERINKTFDLINQAYEDFGFYITEEYKDLRQKQLQLAYEYRLKQHREKEEQDNIRKIMREEEKAEKEIQAALIKADAEEKKYLDRIEKVSNTIATLQGEKLSKALAQIAELEMRLEEAKANKERALSMAQQTKRGHVYVISNIGSFGKNVFKIGVTRRLDPMDRVRELGDASVPFPFDVHAMIFSEDSIALETALHKEFESRRVNMRNSRKEFFNVTLEEIADVVKKYNANIEFTQIAEARDYRETVALRAQFQPELKANEDYPLELFA